MADVLRTFLETSVMAAVMVCLVWAFRAAFAKKVKPMVMAALWLAVLMRLCVPFILESPVHTNISLPPVLAVPSGSAAEVPVIDPALVSDAAVSGSYPVAHDIADAGMAKPVPVPPVGPTIAETIDAYISGITIWDVLAAAWVAGAAGVLLWNIQRAMMFKRRLKKGGEVTDSAILETMEAHKKALGIKRRVRVWECGCVETPSIFGYFRPYLLLPEGFIKSTGPDRIGHVLLHELCHIRRRDILTGYLWLIAKALHWFNLLAWAAYRMYRDDAELCCDAMVVRYLGDGGQYAYSQTLIDVVRTSARRGSAIAAASLCENQRRLKERVVRMLNPGKRLGAFSRSFRSGGQTVFLAVAGYGYRSDYDLYHARGKDRGRYRRAGGFLPGRAGGLIVMVSL